MALHSEDFDKQRELVAGIRALPVILRLLRDQTDMRFVGIARVTPERWILYASLDEGGFGLGPGDELDVKTTLCIAQLDQPQTIVFDDARSDATYASHPAPRLYGFCSHISTAIHLVDGSYFGSLCALDSAPVAINNERAIGMVEGMAALIGRLLDDAFAHGVTVRQLNHERETAESREQFLAVVAHDIRSPLTTIQNSSLVLARNTDPSMRRVSEMLRSSTTRMSGLVDDLVDFARGRAGSTMPLRLAEHVEIDILLEAVVQEKRDAFPERDIRSDLQITCPVMCDPARLQQLVSNLLGNALAYGAASTPIIVEATESEGVASIAVTNWGDPIPPHMQHDVFLAYARASLRRPDGSMGLGLHICQLIAHAHRGQLSVTSDIENGTRFEMRWPSACD